MPDIVITVDVAELRPTGRHTAFLQAHQDGRFVDAETIVQNAGRTLGEFRAEVADALARLLDRAQ